MPRRRDRTRHSPSAEGGQVIFEFISIGQSVKVSAIDVATGTEVSIVGAASATDAELKDVAYQKLRYVMTKNG